MFLIVVFYYRPSCNNANNKDIHVNHSLKYCDVSFEIDGFYRSTCDGIGTACARILRASLRASSCGTIHDSIPSIDHETTINKKLYKQMNTYLEALVRVID